MNTGESSSQECLSHCNKHWINCPWFITVEGPVWIVSWFEITKYLFKEEDTTESVVCTFFLQTFTPCSSSSDSRRSSLCTTWCLQRCWPSLRTPPTSCWSCLKISATSSETPRCTARPSSSPAPHHPTTTHGRSKEGTAEQNWNTKYLSFSIENISFWT